MRCRVMRLIALRIIKRARAPAVTPLRAHDDDGERVLALGATRFQNATKRIEKKKKTTVTKLFFPCLHDCVYTFIYNRFVPANSRTDSEPVQNGF